MLKKKDMPSYKLSPDVEEDFEKVPGPSFDTVQEAWVEGDSFFEKVGNAISETALGRNTVGRVLGIGLDIGLGFVPHGNMISDIREKGKRLLGQSPRKFQYQSTEKPMFTKALKRAFTTDGGGWLRIRDEDGNFSITAVTATIIRLVFLLALLWGGQKLGLPVEQILSLIGLGG